MDARTTTPAPALVVTDTMRRRHYAAIAAAEAGYAMRTAPAREHAGLPASVRRAVLTGLSAVRMATR